MRLNRLTDEDVSELDVTVELWDDIQPLHTKKDNFTDNA